MKIVRKVGDKGQLTIPKEIRDLMDIEDGDLVEFELVAVHVPKAARKAPRVGVSYQRREVPNDQGASA